MRFEVLVAVVVLLAGCTPVMGGRAVQRGSHRIAVDAAAGLFGDEEKSVVGGGGLSVRSGLTEWKTRALEIEYGARISSMQLSTVLGHAGLRFQFASTGETEGLYATTFDRVTVGYNWGESSLPLFNEFGVVIGHTVGAIDTYFAVANHLDLRDPNFVITPAIGALFEVGTLFSLSVEARQNAINRRRPLGVSVFPPTTHGAFSLAFGATFRLGASREE